MSDSSSSSKSVLLDKLIADYVQATERGEQQDRAALLAANPELAAELQKFFQDFDHLKATHLQQGIAAESGVTEVESQSPGGFIAGRYKLLENIGEGGMGSVWVAEQKEPVKRKVAIKLIKAGMDSKQVLARFEAERQALALMDHPHIAKVLDAGTDEKGRPYFVMEYVKGKPITTYADRQQLSIAERLELVEQVCQAIQHAHHKGVIHRDLKPSNILVSTVDGKPFAKVIDFGIAKAIGQQLTDKTIFTLHDQFVGTPQYMSPEQAEGSLDIDTRTDVYSLGVLLYELLTGSPPFSATELKQAAWEQLRKKVMEVDPPKPSTRLSESGEVLATLATSRKTEPKRLGALVRGELDWIVMKALEKDRKRRYETPTSLANDLQAHLKGEAIQAAPPSKLYQLQKLVRRHKVSVVTVGTVMLALLLGIAGTFWGFRRSQIANAELKSYAGKLQDVFGQWYAETNRHAVNGEDKMRASSSEARLADGFRIHVDYSDSPPRVRTWIDEGANMHQTRMQVADDLGKALLHEFRNREAALRDLQAARDNAEQVLAKGILRSFAIGLDGEDGPYTLMKPAEINAYVDWCAIKDERLRFRIMEFAFEDTSTAVRIANRSPQVIQAVAGVSPKIRQKLRKWLLERQRDPSADFQTRIAAAQLSLSLLPMDTPALRELLEPDSPLLWAATGMLVHQISLLSASQVSECAESLPKFLTPTKGSDGPNSVIDLYESVAPRLTDEEVQNTFDNFVLRLDSEPKGRTIAWVLNAHAAILSRLTPDRVVRSCDKIITLMLSNGDSSLDSKAGDEKLAEVLSKLTTEQLQTYGEKATQLLETSNKSRELASARQLLRVISARWPRSDLNLHADRLIGRIATATDNIITSQITDRLKEITAELSGDPQRRRIDRLLERLTPDANDLQVIYTCSLLETWVPMFTLEQSQVFGDRLIGLIAKGLPREGPIQATRALSKVVPQLREEQIIRADIECRLLLEMGQNDWLGMLGIAAIAPRMTSDQAETAAFAIFDSMKKSRSGDGLEDPLGAAYTAVGACLTKAASQKLGDELLKYMMALADRSGNANVQRTYGLIALRSIAKELSPSQLEQGWQICRECWNAQTTASDVEGWQRLGLISSSKAALIAIANQLEADKCTSHLNKLIQWTSIGQRDEWAKIVCDIVADAAPRITGEKATQLLDALVNWYQKAADPEVNKCIESTMLTLSPKFTPEQLTRWTQVLVSEAENSTDRQELTRLGEALNKLSPYLPEEQRNRVAEAVLVQLYEIAGEQSSTSILYSIEKWNMLIADQQKKEFLTKLVDLWNKRLEDPASDEFFSFHDAYISWDSSHLDRMIGVLSDGRFVAKLLQHPNAVDVYYADDAIRIRLLERFEELVLHDGKPLWSALREQESRDKDDPRPLEASLLQLPQRKFRTLDDAASWISSNWPDFDLEAVWSPGE